MLRREYFLERIHHVLSLPGTSVAHVARVLDRCLQGCGELVPTDVVLSALAIQDALVRGGILAARRTVEVLRRQAPPKRTSGVFVGPLAPGRTSERPLVQRRDSRGYRVLAFEKADDGSVQLLSLDQPRPVRVGAPRQVTLLHFVYKKGEATLREAVEATGTGAMRATRVYYETRKAVGPEWLEQSDAGSANPSRRMIRFRPPAGVEDADLSERRVRTLTPAPSAPVRQAK